MAPAPRAGAADIARTGINTRGSHLNTPSLHTRRLSPDVAELLGDHQAGLPVWIRSPKSGTEFYSGLSRSKLYQLAADRLIRSVSIRQPGQVKGTRLFHLGSILSFIESLEEDSNSKSETGGEGSGVPKSENPLSY